MKKQRERIPTEVLSSNPAQVTRRGDSTFALAMPHAFPAPEPVAWTTVIEVDRAYVVLDDLDGNLAVLVVSSWPVLDELGRLRFPDEEGFQLAADAQALHQKVSAARLRTVVDRTVLDDPDAVEAANRPLRVGDTFEVTIPAGGEGIRSRLAALARAPDAEGDDAELARQVVFTELEDFEFRDVTPWARDATKLAFYTAVAPSLTMEEYGSITSEDDEPEEPGENEIGG